MKIELTITDCGDPDTAKETLDSLYRWFMFHPRELNLDVLRVDGLEKQIQAWGAGVKL